MKLHRPVLLVLASFVVLPAVGGADAEAGVLRRGSIREVVSSGGDAPTWRVEAVVIDEGEVAELTAKVESDAGDEELTLAATDTWLHGAATLSALPAADADVSLTLYDKGSVPIATFVGTLGADGAVSFEAGEGSADVEVRAAEVFAATKAYDLAIDLAGADTFDVAYATVTLSEAGESVCLAVDEKGNCLKWGSSTGSSTRSEVGWDAVGTVWTADAAVAPEGLVDLRLQARDPEGGKIETAKVQLAAPWADDGGGVGVLGVDGDPLTGVALLRRYDRCGWSRHCKASWSMVVSSDGWTAGGDLPVDAQVEVAGAGVVTIPANSYQRGPLHLCFEEELQAGAIGSDSRLTVKGGGFVLTDQSVSTLTESAVCTSGGCFMLVDNGAGGLGLSVSVYGADPSLLADGADLTLTLTGPKGEPLGGGAAKVEFDPELTVVFGRELEFAADPLGLDISAKVSLLGSPNRKGKQKTLVKGNVYGGFSRDADGDLELAGVDKDGLSSAGGILSAGDVETLETSDTNKDGRIAGPPLAVRLRGIDKETLRRGMVVGR